MVLSLGSIIFVMIVFAFMIYIWVDDTLFTRDLRRYVDKTVVPVTKHYGYTYEYWDDKNHWRYSVCAHENGIKIGASLPGYMKKRLVKKACRYLEKENYTKKETEDDKA